MGGPGQGVRVAAIAALFNRAAIDTRVVGDVDGLLSVMPS